MARKKSCRTPETAQFNADPASERSVLERLGTPGVSATGQRPLKVLSVFGTRPEAIKLAPVIAELRRRSGIVSRVCVTAQHRKMLDQVLTPFEIQPDCDLDLMRKNQTLPRLTALAMQQLEEVFRREQPDWILVQGDTTTTMVATLGAFYARAKIGHVEAGLRSGDKRQPFPEGIRAGNVRLVGSAPQRIIPEAARLLEDPREHSRMAKVSSLYGDSYTAVRIASALQSSQLCTASFPS